jgi:hypothetical protein
MAATANQPDLRRDVLAGTESRQSQESGHAVLTGITQNDNLNRSMNMNKVHVWGVPTARFLPGAWIVAAAVFLPPAAHANLPEEEEARLLEQAEPRLKAVYEKNEFAARSFRATWMPDGSAYLKLETADGAAGPEIASYDPAGGKRTVLASAEKLVVPGSSRRLTITEFFRSPAGSRFLLRVQRDDAEYWVFDPEPGTLRSVDGGLDVPLGAEAFSPDGRRLLCAREGNLFVFDIGGGSVTQLTKDAVPGTLDYGRASWSPDGRYVAFV